MYGGTVNTGNHINIPYCAYHIKKFYSKVIIALKGVNHKEYIYGLQNQK